MLSACVYVHQRLEHYCNPSETAPKGARGYLMSTPCLESQGYYLIPISYLRSLLSCFSAYSSCSVLSFFC